MQAIATRPSFHAKIRPIIAPAMRVAILWTMLSIYVISTRYTTEIGSGNVRPKSDASQTVDLLRVFAQI